MDLPVMPASISSPTDISSATDVIAVHDMMFPSDTPGIDLHLRRKHVETLRPFPAERTVVLVHGATYSSASLFDVRLDGISFMDHLALQGFDVYALDVRGYGGSTRPPEMDAAPENYPPSVGTEVGVRDLATAVDHVLARTGLERLNLVAMSWGGTVAGAFTSRHNEKVVRLALVAPQWLSDKPVPIDTGVALGAYRRVPVLETKEQWLNAAPADKRAALLSPGWFEAWAEVSLDSDPLSRVMSPPTLRAANGPIQDIRAYWTAGKPFYDPGAITAPVLLVHAEWDVDVPLEVASAFFRAVRNARYRRWVEIGEGTHRVLLERNRWQAFNAISSFLREAERSAV